MPVHERTRRAETEPSGCFDLERAAFAGDGEDGAIVHVDVRITRELFARDAPELGRRSAVTRDEVVQVLGASVAARARVEQ
jgi:hypothetical protein